MMENGSILQAIDATIRILNSVSVPVELLEKVGIPIMAARKNLENILESIRKAGEEHENVVPIAPEDPEEEIRG